MSNKKPPEYWRRWQHHTPRRTTEEVAFAIAVRDIRTAPTVLKSWARRDGTLATDSVAIVKGLPQSGCLTYSLRLKDLLADRSAPLGPVVATVCETRDSWIARGYLRRWLICPRCTAHRVALYALNPVRAIAVDELGDVLSCRECLGLKYLTQRMTPKQRREHRAQKAAKVLWSELRYCHYTNPPRLPGMHRQTYERLVAEIEGWRRGRRRKRRKPPVEVGAAYTGRPAHDGG